MLARQERDHVRAGDAGAEICDEVSEVVLLLGADRAIRDHHPNVEPRERADRMIRVDPRIDPFARLELGARRAELHRDDRSVRRAEEREEGAQGTDRAAANTRKPRKHESGLAARPWFRGSWPPHREAQGAYCLGFSLYPAGGAKSSSATGVVSTLSTSVCTSMLPIFARMPAIGPASAPPMPSLMCISVS